MSGAIHPLPLYAFMAQAGTALPLHLSWSISCFERYQFKRTEKHSKNRHNWPLQRALVTLSAEGCNMRRTSKNVQMFPPTCFGRDTSPNMSVRILWIKYIINICIIVHLLVICVCLVTVNTRTVAHTTMQNTFSHKAYLFDVFAKVRKTTINFVISVCPSAIQLPLYGFSWNFISQYFSKICRENVSVIKVRQEYPVLYMTADMCTFVIMSHSFPSRVKNVSDKICMEKSHHILCSITFFR